MGRKKIALKRLESATARQAMFTKRTDGIMKKATELSILCDTHVSLVMFSPTGELETFSSNGSVEDIFLRFVDRPADLRGGPISNEQVLSRKLHKLKYERALLEKIATVEDLKEKLDGINQRLGEAQGKMRYYEPKREDINTALEAGAYEQYLISSIDRIQIAKVQMLSNQLMSQRIDHIEETTYPMEDDETSGSELTSNANLNRMSSQDAEVGSSNLVA